MLIRLSSPKGRPAGIHVEDVAFDEATGHLLGRCRRCPRVKDYSVLQFGADIVSAKQREIYQAKNRKGGKRVHGIIDKEAEAGAVFSD